MTESEKSIEWLEFHEIKRLISLWKMVEQYSNGNKSADILLKEVSSFFYECEECHKTFTLKNIEAHFLIHQGRYKLYDMDRENPSRR